MFTHNKIKNLNDFLWNATADRTKACTFIELTDIQRRLDSLYRDIMRRQGSRA